MRWLVIAVAAAAVLWSGWWVLGSRAALRGAEAAVEAARADGWTVAWDDIGVSGYPNRFDLTAEGLTVATPDGAWRIAAPFLQIFALSYRPNHLIAVAPPVLEVDGPFGPVDVAEEDLRASLVVAPGPDLALRRATVAGRSIVLTSSLGTLSMEAAQIALRESGTANGYDLAVGARDVALPERLLSGLDANGALPPSIGTVEVQATAILDRPIDRHTRGPVGVEALTVGPASLRWGALDLGLRGDLVANAAGRAEGTLEVDVGDVDALFDALGPYLPEGQALLIRSLVTAAASDGWLPLSVSDGTARFGPVPLFALPPMAP